MSKQTEAMKLALGALELGDDASLAERDTAITALREALASEAKEQPRGEATLAQPLTDEQCDAIYTALDEWAKEFDRYEFGLPVHCGGGMVGGRAIIRAAAHGITVSNKT